MVLFEGFGDGDPDAIRSASVMADVFEEDEDEAEEGALNERHQDTSSIWSNEEEGLGIDIIENDSINEGAGMDWTVGEAEPEHRGLKRKGSAMSEEQLRITTQRSKGSLKAEPIAEESHETVPSQDRPNSITRSSDSTITSAPVTDESLRKSKPLKSDIGTPNPPFLMPDTPSFYSNSPFPSPEIIPTASFEAPRALTATSSFTDEPDYDPLNLREPSPGFRMSVDDVPSLISGSSTMTSAVNVHGVHPNFLPRNGGERAMSMSSAVTGRSQRSGPGKRSSLASLSKLISGSHGEKSKLSIEERAQGDDMDESGRKKEKRWSRIMFWKSKRSSVIN
jgi:hypothetical protein